MAIRVKTPTPRPAWIAMRLLVGALLVLTSSCTQPTPEDDLARSPSPPASVRTAPGNEATPVPSTTRVAPDSTFARSPNISILFVGNSHTANHDIPQLVEGLLESDGIRQVSTQIRTSEFLRTALDSQSVTEAISSGDWDIVVLQGQEISQSHTISYSTSEAETLAKLAGAAGAEPLFFSEWSRRDIDETDYIEGIYVSIASRTLGKVIPVGRAWDLFLEDQPGYELWARDGNHASADGALLAAATIAYFIAGPDALITTADPNTQPLLEAAQFTVVDRMQN